MFWPNNWGETYFEADILEKEEQKREWHLGLEETINKKEVRETIGLVETVFERVRGKKCLMVDPLLDGPSPSLLPICKLGFFFLFFGPFVLITVADMNPIEIEHPFQGLIHYSSG